MHSKTIITGTLCRHLLKTLLYYYYCVLTLLKRYVASESRVNEDDLELSLTFDTPQAPKSLKTITTIPTPKLKHIQLSSPSRRVLLGHSWLGLKCEEAPNKKQASDGSKKVNNSFYV